MSNYKINELPVLTEHGSFDEMAIIDPDGVTRKVYISDKIYLTEEDAIKRIKELFAEGSKAFILRYQP